MRKNKVSIKEVMATLVNIGGVEFISDADVNSIMYPKTKRAARGKSITKEKLVNMDNNVKIGDSLLFEFIGEIDDCYYNNVMQTR